jgi:glycosyltransferase involved in cell wall biosynthesis
MSEHSLRILHLTLGADAGGLSRYITDLSLAMHKLGHEITVAGDTGAWQWLFDSMPFPYVQIPLKGGVFAFQKSVRTMRDYVREHPIDLIHTHYRRGTLLGRRLQKTIDVPILYTVHLSHISLKFPRSLFTDFGDHSHVASPEARQWLIDDAHVPSERISLIPHGVDVDKFAVADISTKHLARESFGLQVDDRIAVYVGRLDQFHPKHVEWLVDLAAIARDKIPNLKLLLVGEGPHEPMLREQIARLNVSDRVFLTGHRDPLPAYQAADALLLPSAREGFSLVCAEAMGVGVPALRTRTSGTSLLIEENVTGRSVSVDRETFIAAAIEFLSDPIALQRMGRAAAALIRQKYTFQQQLSATLDLYRRLTTLPAVNG